MKPGFVFILFFMLSTFMVSLCEPVFAADELAPGLNRCLEKAETTGYEAACYSEAVKYLSPKLEQAYSNSIQRCKQESNSTQCIAKLKKMQQTWLSYTDQMINILLGEEIAPGVHSNAGRLDAKIFEAEATILQFRALTGGMDIK